MSFLRHFSHTVISGLLLLTLFYSNSALGQTIYYVKYNNTVNTSATGTFESPFSSVNQAVSKLGVGTFELLLLGNSFFLTSVFAVPSNSNYTIRPASLPTEQTYFPFYLNKSVAISVSKFASLTIQQIQLIEVDTARSTSNPAFRILQGAILTFDGILLANVNYTTSVYYFAYMDGAGQGKFNIKNCEFTNMTNPRMQIASTKVTITNTMFSGFVQSRTAFLYMVNTYGSEYDITFKNVTVKNSNFTNVPSGSTFGFFYLVKSTSNIILEDFTMRDIAVTNRFPFIILTPIVTGTPLPVIKGKNVIVENMFEMTSPDGNVGQVALFLQIQGKVNIDFTNFTITNLQLQYSAFIQGFLAASDTLELVTNATFSNMTVRNSTNAYFKFKYYDTFNLTNLQLCNIAYSPPYSIVAMFEFAEARTIVINGFQSQNTTGPIIKTADVFNQTFQDWNLNDVYTSTKWTSRYPVYFTRVRNSVSFTQWQAQKDISIISMENIKINGYYDINGLTSTGNDGGAYAVAIISEYGKAYLINSRFYNMKLSSFGAGYTNHLQIDNLTVDSDPSIPVSAIPQHAIFKFGEIRELSIINSNFLNQKNMIILILYFLHRSNDYELVSHPILLFENLTVINNMVNTLDLNTAYPSLFNIRTPLYPVTASFKNSYFQGNTVLTAVILTDESLQVDVDFINNTFTDNYAILDGGVIAAESMRGQMSNINMTNNVFGNNTSLKNGGVLFFLSTQHNIASANNLYYNNEAKGSGGVGYFSHVNLSYSETNGTYLNNSAENYGGAWFFSIRRNQAKQPQVKFIRTSFGASQALRKGGAIYIETGDVYLGDTSFTQSSARESGGDIYLVALASITMVKVNSTGSYSPQGSFMYAEATTNETITLQNMRITDIPLSVVDTSLLVLNAGSLLVSDSVFKDISSPLFQISSGSVTFLRNSLHNIQCQTIDTAYCIFQGSGSTFFADGLHIDDVTSHQNLIVMKASSNNFTIKNTSISNVKKMELSREYFAVVLNKVDNAHIIDSNFTQLEFTGVKAQSTNLHIVNGIFSNADAVAERVLQETNSTGSRFIILDSSSSLITDSGFIANSAGALQIIGNQGNHNISGCYFEGNNGINGGAISIEGSITSLNIERSEFRNNTASQNGGSIFLTSQGSNITPLISQTIFQGNLATYGGAIYVNNFPLMIQNSVFDGNTAESGAGIVSSCESSQRISLMGNTFTRNTAHFGSGLVAFGDLNFDTQNTKFYNNTAEYGRDIAGKPHHLQVKVYKFSETFLFIENISIDYIKSNDQTALVYDSQNVSLQAPLMMKPGRIPNYLLELEVLNELDQSITLQSMDLTFKTSMPTASDTALASNASTSSLFGTLEYSFNKSRDYIFNSFYIRGKFGKNLTLSVQSVAHDNFSNQAYNLPRLELPITIGICSVGETYDDKKLLCKPCSKDTFSLGDPFIVQTCKKCPSSATCLGGNIIYPKQGYWRIDQASGDFLKCANKFACPGGEADEGRSISFTGFCGTGYEGVACGSCSEGYVKTGLNNECISCSTGIRQHIRYTIFLFIRIGLIIFTVGLYLNNSHQNLKNQASRVLQTSFIKVIIDFMHVISPTVALHMEWPEEVREFLDVISSPTSMNRNNFSLDCLITIIRGTNQDIVFFKSLIILLQPAIFFIFATIAVVCIYKIIGKTRQNLGLNIIIIAVVTGYICQPDILQSTFQLFTCQNFGSTENVSYLLAQDTSVECWGSHHIVWILCLAVPSLIIWLFIPVAILVRLLLQQELLKSEAPHHHKYDLLLEKYQSNKFYWELMIFSRKLILIIASMLSSFAYLQTYICFTTLVVAYLLHKKFQPYSDLRINRIESVSLFTSAGIMYTGLYFVRIIYGETLESLVPWFFGVDIFSGVLFFGYCLYVIRVLIKQRIMTFRSKFIKTVTGTTNFGKSTIGMPLQSQTSHIPPLLDFEKKVQLNNGRSNKFPSRGKKISLGALDCQSPELPLKTELPITTGDEVDRFYSPRNRSTMFFETERNNLLTTPRTTENIYERATTRRSLEKHLFSIKSLDTLCLEIDEEINENEEPIALPKQRRLQNIRSKKPIADDKILPMSHLTRNFSKFSNNLGMPSQLSNEFR